MVNKVTASITRSRQEPDLKSPTIPRRFIRKLAEFGTTHGLAPLHLAGRRAAREGLRAGFCCALWPWASISSSIKWGQQRLHSSVWSGRRDEVMDMIYYEAGLKTWGDFNISKRGKRRETKEGSCSQQW